MVKIMEHPIEMDDLGVPGTTIFGNTHIEILIEHLLICGMQYGCCLLC